MKKFVLMLALAFAASNAQASNINTLMSDIGRMTVTDVRPMNVFNWVVGDEAIYDMAMLGGIMKGTMTMSVKALSSTELVLGQDMDLGFLGKQSCDVTMDPNTGAQKSIVCNGQAQQAPDQSDMEVIDSKEDTITVPAGTFLCLYIRAKTGGQEVQQWADPKDVPVMGMVKSILPSQFGEITVELKSFKKM